MKKFLKSYGGEYLKLHLQPSVTSVQSHLTSVIEENPIWDPCLEAWSQLESQLGPFLF